VKRKRTVDSPWHPNFRQAATLPDIRAVRSAFFVNVLFLSLALFLCGYWFFLEYRIATMSDLLASNQSEIAFREKSNRKLLKASIAFEKHQETLDEIKDFIWLPFTPSAFLEQMATSKPSNMIIKNLSYQFEGRAEVKKGKDKKKTTINHNLCQISLSGSASGSSRVATASIEEFRDGLASLPIFEGMTVTQQPTLKSFHRDLTLDIYTFTLEMELEL